MLKSILYLSLSFLLSFSILGSSLLEFYTSDLDEIVFVDTSEEEQQNKTESEIKDIKIFEKDLSALRSLNSHASKSLSNHYQMNYSDDYLEIQHPPPRYKV